MTASRHPCPICGGPTNGGPRYPRAVCRDCADRATDSSGRRVVGYNTDLSGGFVAQYADGDAAGETCDEVTRQGRCWIDGRQCTIGEAHFGGVVIEG